MMATTACLAATSAMLLAARFGEGLSFMSDPAHLVVLIGAIYSICLHEAAHAYASNALGDPTPARFGRVTLNPVPHIQATPFATALLPVLTWFASQGGWAVGGGACPVQPLFYRNPRRDSFLVAFAGPLTNLLIAALCLSMLLFEALTPFESFNFRVFHQLGLINFVVALFNLLPLPMFDGGSMLAALLPPVEALFQRAGQFGFFFSLFLGWILFRQIGEPIVGNFFQWFYSVLVTVRPDLMVSL